MKSLKKVYPSYLIELEDIFELESKENTYVRGIMKKIDVKTTKISELNQKLFEGKILDAASIYCWVMPYIQLSFLAYSK